MFRDQRLFRHGVDSVESTDGGRWAYSFCIFKPLSKTDKSVPTPRLSVSASVSVAEVSPVSSSFGHVEGFGSSSAHCTILPVYTACNAVGTQVSLDSIVRKSPDRALCKSFSLSSTPAIECSVPSDSSKQCLYYNHLYG